MLLRYSGGVYTDLIRFHTPFIMISYFDEQLTNHGSLEISPSFCEGCVSDRVREIAEDIIPDLTIVETMISESYDFANSLGINYGNHYDNNNGHMIPVMVAVGENGKVIRTSYGKCFCMETLLELVAEMDINLLKPPSVSES